MPSDEYEHDSLRADNLHRIDGVGQDHGVSHWKYKR